MTVQKSEYSEIPRSARQMDIVITLPTSMKFVWSEFVRKLPQKDDYRLL